MSGRPTRRRVLRAVAAAGAVGVAGCSGDGRGDDGDDGDGDPATEGTDATTTAATTRTAADATARTTTDRTTRTTTEGTTTDGTTTGTTGRAAFVDGEVTVGLSPTVPQSVLREQYRPVREHLREELDVPVALEVQSSAAAAIRGLGDGAVDVAETGPLAAAVGARRGDARILLQRFGYGSWTYTSLLAARRDLGASSPGDLAGRTVAFADRLSLSGSLYPLYALQSRGGLDVGDLPTGSAAGADFEAVFTGSHVAAWEVLADGEVDAAAFGGFVRDTSVGPSPSEYEAAARTVVETGGIPRAPIVASPRLTAGERDAVATALVTPPDAVYYGADGERGTRDDLWYTRVRRATADTYEGVLEVASALDLGLDALRG